VIARRERERERERERLGERERDLLGTISITGPGPPAKSDPTLLEPEHWGVLSRYHDDIELVLVAELLTIFANRCGFRRRRR
jgi:hypothetical protein